MANMGYVRFQNTLGDLRACESHLWDVLGMDENRARLRLIKLCRDIIKQVEIDIEFFAVEDSDNEKE